MNKITVILTILSAFIITGCNSKSDSEKALETMLKPKNAEVKTYDQIVYEMCLEDKKTNTAKGECHAPEPKK